MFCGMLDLCRIICRIVVDLFRPRAAMEAEIIVLRQQIFQKSHPIGPAPSQHWSSTGWF
jgi:hypothetical protein